MQTLDKSIFILDITDKKTNSMGKSRFTALAKCRKDPVELLMSMGAQNMGLEIFSLEGHSHMVCSFLWRWNSIYLWWQLRQKLSTIKNSIIFIQYPFSATGLHPRFIINRLRLNGNKIILLVHDIESIRHISSKSASADKYILANSDISILHSSAMINIAKKFAPKGKYIALEFFDYKSNLNLPTPSDLRNIKLIFAGNLAKSDFLNEIDKVHFTKQFQLYLYGLASTHLKTSENVIYKGTFDAEKFENVEGNWGLVWDGTSVDSCIGNFGEYQRLNAPFKFSFYLAAKRPVVVWSHAAMAEYVKKYHLGIAVEHINDIPKVVATLTDYELEQIKRGVEYASAEVRSGNKLRTALEQALNILQK